MARSWQAIAEARQLHELSLSQGLELLLQAESRQRSSRRFDRLQKNARFRYQASGEELNYEASRGLDRSLISMLATGQYLEKGESILERQQQPDLMEIIEDQHGKASTIIASQLPVANWYDVIGEETIADAILDRLVHSSYRIELKGESLRKKR